METKLVYANGAIALTNSILVAKKFDRNHRDVLDSIRELVKGCAENSADPMFEETTYIHPQNGQTYPMFIMNRDGFTLLAMGFTGEKALRFKLDYIKAFNVMEETIKNPHRIPQTLPEALRLAADHTALYRCGLTAVRKVFKQPNRRTTPSPSSITRYGLALNNKIYNIL